jgi:transcriptional regulator with XRE-family HTH domain
VSDRDRSPGGTREGEDAGDTLPIERRRAALGLRLVDLRKRTGLTQKDLAAAVGIRQPTVSGFESGREIPTPDMIGRIARALGLDEETRQELEDRIGELRVEVRAARLLARQGPRAVQGQIGSREAASTEICSYHLGLVPGLLQTPEYVRALGAVLDPDVEVDVDGLITAREERQRLLLDPRHRFRFLMAEAALRARISSVEVHRAQLRRVLALADGFPHVEVGVIPAAVQLTAWTLAGFDLIGDTVEVEYATGSVLLRDPRDVDVYRRLFDRLDAEAVHGEDLVALIRGIDAWLAAIDG